MSVALAPEHRRYFDTPLIDDWIVPPPRDDDGWRDLLARASDDFNVAESVLRLFGHLPRSDSARTYESFGLGRGELWQSSTGTIRYTDASADEADRARLRELL